MCATGWAYTSSTQSHGRCYGSSRTLPATPNGKRQIQCSQQWKRSNISGIQFPSTMEMNHPL